jgi:hypothetical protein
VVVEAATNLTVPISSPFNEATAGLDICLARLPLGWHGAYRHFRHPLDYLGADGGGGVGAGPGLVAGTALALKGQKRIAAGILGDGDFLMGVTALWTAVHYKMPCLLVVANNRSFYNDELHQERVAKERARPTENKWIGQRIDEPDIDLAMMARAQGEGMGPVKTVADLKPAMDKAVQSVKGEGKVCVVDVREVQPGYDTNMGGLHRPRGRYLASPLAYRDASAGCGRARCNALVRAVNYSRPQWDGWSEITSSGCCPARCSACAPFRSLLSPLSGVAATASTTGAFCRSARASRLRSRCRSAPRSRWVS